MTKIFVHEYIYDDYGYNDDYDSYAYRSVIIMILILILIRSVIFFSIIRVSPLTSAILLLILAIFLNPLGPRRC